jgi:hypothetical protein
MWFLLLQMRRKRFIGVCVPTIFLNGYSGCTTRIAFAIESFRAVRRVQAVDALAW